MCLRYIIGGERGGLNFLQAQLNTASLRQVLDGSISRSYSLEVTRNLAHYAAAAAKLLQLCQTLCDPIDSSPLGSPIPGILQARTLEWVAIPFSYA